MHEQLNSNTWSCIKVQQLLVSYLVLEDQANIIKKYCDLDDLKGCEAIDKYFYILRLIDYSY